MRTEERFYRIGGLVWSVSGPECKELDRLSIFGCTPEKADARVEVEVVDSPEIPQGQILHRDVFNEYLEWQDGRARIVYLENDGRAILSERDVELNLRHTQYAEYALQYYGGKMTLRILDLPRQILKWDGVFLHASYIEVGGKAILFTAPKQTGKSTQAELWRRYRGAQVVNGDRALLRKVDGVWHAFGSPYCGTSDICHNVTCPVEAIVVLGQGPENNLHMARPREALAALLNGFTYDTWDRVQMECVLHLAEEIMQDIPIIRMDCLPDESAVSALEEVLWKKR